MLLCLGGIHGNEPSGVAALKRVFATLEKEAIPVRGRFLGLAGNLPALKAGVRYLERDMNRMWAPETLRRALDPGPAPETAGPGSGHGSEWAQVRDLHLTIRGEVENWNGEVHFLDLHTSSADGVPFVCVGDTLRNRRFSRPFPVSVVLGLEEQLDGSLLEYLNNRGVITMGFEGGHHDAPHSIDRHEAGIWVALASAGCIPFTLEQVGFSRSLLVRARDRLPMVLEIRYRHPLHPGDGFKMMPGYENFFPVKAGEVLANDHNGPIRAYYRSRIMLPLYQGKGEDGFFLAREVRRVWLSLSSLLRRMRADRLVPLLPGVRRHPHERGALLVDKRVARWLTIQVFHLLGFRKRREHGDLLVVSRRRFDLKPPSQVKL